MKYQCILNVTGFIFLGVALLHLLRIIFKVRVMIGMWNVPLWVSGIGLLVALGLSGWMFYCRKN